MTTPNSGTVAKRGSSSTASYAPPRTTYTLKLDPSQYSSTTAPPPRPSAPSMPSGGERVTRFNGRAAAVIGQGAAQQVKVPKGIPAIFGNQTVIIMAWFVALAIIAYAEWKQNNILARPKRLWYTTLVYGILCVVGMVEALVPLATALAVGYTIVLGWQYFNAQGQFEQATGGGSSTNNGSGNGGGGGGGGGKR